MAKLLSHRLAQAPLVHAPIVRAPIVRVLGALSLLIGLTACVGPQPRYYGGGYGRAYAWHQPVHRGGYGHGWHGGPQRGWH